MQSSGMQRAPRNSSAHIIFSNWRMSAIWPFALFFLLAMTRSRVMLSRQQAARWRVCQYDIDDM